MRHILCILFVMYLPIITLGQELVLSKEELSEQMVLAEEFINEQNEEFRDPEHSPLHKDSIQYFDALDYFPVNEKFIVKAKYKRIKKGKTFEMKTTTARLPVYKDFAILTFEIDGRQYTLHAYQNIDLVKREEYKNHLFLPFNDHTNGIESYGGGRYLDLEQTTEDYIVLNFNKTYNPYCAYNDRYSCPIPPDENKLELRIEAGIKKFH